VLEDAGYQVVRARDGAEALVRVAEHQPNLVLSDIMLPGMTGLELWQALQADPTYQTIPVIFSSAVVERTLGAAYHYAAYLEKPFDLLHVVHTVAEVMRSQADREAGEALHHRTPA
jgi:CheY-like chemotaxis protein